jgi:hypothetical protein
MQFGWGYAPPLIIEAAVKHQWFDLLEAAPSDAAELAQRAGASLRGVQAVCNALVGLGLLARKGGRYTLTEESAQLLKKTFGALASGGTIAILEFLVNEDRNGPPNGLIFAVNMLVHTETGDTYSFEEISGWLREAGFIKPRLLPVPGPSPLVLATKP